MVNPVIYNTRLPPIWHLDPWDMEFQTPESRSTFHCTMREKVAGLVWGENKSKSLDQQDLKI